jgi:hypothetical protein
MGFGCDMALPPHGLIKAFLFGRPRILNEMDLLYFLNNLACHGMSWEQDLKIFLAGIMLYWLWKILFFDFF